MVMKKASGMISPLRQGAGKLQIHPDLGMMVAEIKDCFVDF